MMKLFAVFGNPIAHSKSPILHNYTLYKLKIDARYSRYLLDSSKDFRELFFLLGLSGANITLPYKEDVANICDEICGIAQKIGAVNTIIKKDNKIIGYNTDAIGFYKNIESKNIKNALILGAGGSAKAIAMILKEKNINVIISNRSKKNLSFFDEKGFETCINDEILECTKKIEFDIIINATSSSINNTLPLQKDSLESLFERSKIAFDLMYGKECIFLEFAKIKGLDTINGSKMLLYQAIPALSIFTNIDETKIKPHMEYIYNIINHD
ncbi:shikimate dehydrogenase [Helicobacter sp. MIT 99-5507]|nr:shikimate dehydrogenase [Helicobacter sp. MIT 99-5507]